MFHRRYWPVTVTMVFFNEYYEMENHTGLPVIKCVGGSRLIKYNILQRLYFNQGDLVNFTMVRWPI